MVRFASATSMNQRRFNIAGKHRVTTPGSRGELRVELTGEEPGVIRQLHHFHQLVPGRPARNPHTLFLKYRHVVVVHLITVAMALLDRGTAIDPSRETALNEMTRLGAQAHCATLV